MFRIFCLVGLLIAASGCAATAPVTPPPAPTPAVSPAVSPQAQAPQAAPAPKPAVKKHVAAKPPVAKKKVPVLAANPAAPPPAPAPAVTPPPVPTPTPAPAPPETPAPPVTAPAPPVAAPPAPPAETAPPGLIASAFALVEDWRDYWYVDLGLLVLLLLLLWLLTRGRSEPPPPPPRSTAGPPAGPPGTAPRPPPTPPPSGAETGPGNGNAPPFARSGITIGRGSEFCVLRFINQGREKAQIESRCLAMAVERVLPPSPSYPAEAVERLAAPVTVETRQQFSIERPNNVAEPDWERIQRGEAALWLYGYFDYRDAQQALRRQGFCFAYLPPAASSIPAGNGRAAAAGPPAYTYSRLAG